ncbi:hypothetical protein QBC37DRAFT_407374 [Rhypophila decipiens]|uniref:Uncharacterized protein n=1 Tax=Rhypophila decipiens TaxID=261697 RepID=A0AAN6XX35_9PEZI|nr:hypothetical protein QBC37DRAFT_407374 [Rhypophila decipiens]
MEASSPWPPGNGVQAPLNDPYDQQTDRDDVELDTHPAITSLTAHTQRFTTRIPFRDDGNPRGKYPRKPLSWPARKLANVVSWEWEADQYRNKLWKWELDRQQKHQRRKDGSDIQVDSTIWEKGPRKEVQRNKDWDKNKPRFPKPHYLAALDAMYRKQGCQRYWVGCPICNMIAAEWVSETKQKSREMAFERQGALWDATNDYAVVDESDIEDEPECRDDEDDLVDDMNTVVTRNDLLSTRAYRIKFVYGTGRRAEKGRPENRVENLACSGAQQDSEILHETNEDGHLDGWDRLDELEDSEDWVLADGIGHAFEAPVGQKAHVARGRFWLDRWFRYW